MRICIVKIKTKLEINELKLNESNKNINYVFSIVFVLFIYI